MQNLNEIIRPDCKICTKKFALLISPIMPIFAEYIWCNLSNEEISFDQSLWVKEGQKVNLSDINTERFYLND